MSRTRRNHQAASGYGLYWLGLREKKGRDKKPWFCPPGWFKRINRRIERARARMAVAMGRDPERVRRGDRWDWT